MFPPALRGVLPSAVLASTRATLLLASASLALGAQAATLQVGNGAEPSTLDPQKVNGNWESRITRELFDRLINHGPDGSLEPGLAESWTLSDDGLVYTFTLRQAHWSDGEPITADDAVFALQRLVTPATANHNANLYYPIVNARAINTGKAEPESLGVSALDTHTLEIRLSEPTAYFLQAMAMTEAAPLPRHLLESGVEDWTRPGTLVASGPFVLADWKPQDKVEVSRNPHYYAADEVALDGVDFHAIEDTSALMNRFRSGELDIAYGAVPSARFEWAQENLSESLRVGPLIGSYFYMLNLRDGTPLSDKRVREALNLALDREVITERLLGMGQTPSYWFVPHTIASPTSARLDFHDQDMDSRRARARMLLDQAGYGPDRPLELELSYNTLEDHKKIAVAIAAMWRPLGVEIELVNREAAVHFAGLKQGDFEIARYGLVATVNDPYDFLNAYAAGGSAAASTGYADPEYDALVEASTHELDVDRRAALMTEAEQRLLDADVMLPIYDYVVVNLVSPDVEGWQPTALDVHPLRYVSVDEAAAK
ncbi:peptide ABC transporter substrate-binding protein [Halomonas denitrificans]|uniref:peptide ABC transporter substrate-binding protein n=1 Tax=Halomonas denitrificans TaxID=370769 RepID=UPI001CD64289|nr:peptide ABC transporter substrate-binding protein [Halomonas denitrificans]MCA0975917.1 peptide ABC transporter substrate-binding protein [Halomonas denitrificans]